MIDDSQEMLNDTPDPGNEEEAPRRRSRRRGRRGKSRGAAANAADQQTDSTAEAPPEPQSHRPVQQPHPEPSRQAEQRRSTRANFGDSLDRQICVARMPGYPTEWPVNHRTGLAIQPLVEVGRNAESLLLCDLTHEGPCVWPGYLGVEAGQPLQENAVETESAPPPEEPDHEIEVLTETVLVVDIEESSF